MRRSLALGIAVVTGALIAGLVVAEIGLRVAGFAHASLYARDERRGWALRPGVTAWVGTEAGRRLVRTSRAGLRDREHAIEKPPGTVRIADLGDSFTEALRWQPRRRSGPCSSGRCKAAPPTPVVPLR